MTSEDYFLQKVLPKIRENIRPAIRRFGKLRGRGFIHRKTKSVEFILDVPNPHSPWEGDTTPILIVMGGSYMFPDDNEYDIFIQSHAFPGTHQYHEKLSRRPQRDARKMVRTTVELLDDYIR